MDRVGLGFDSHRFAPGRPLMLAGVHVEHDLGLAGHSDGDAPLHALIDAMLGAAGLDDIGEMFPDTDPAWANADSDVMVTEVVSELARLGLIVINSDLTIITEAPKLTAHKQAMRERVADLLGTDTSNVSVKAKTAEGLGPIGAGEGLVALAVVMLEDTTA